MRRDSPKPTELAFLSFLILVTLSVVATAWMGHDQDQDALVINLVRRHRMLAQQITSQALQIQWGENKDEHRRILRDAETTFDQTLTALMSGGETEYLPGRMVDIPATRSNTIQAALRELQQHWTGFRLDLRCRFQRN